MELAIGTKERERIQVETGGNFIVANQTSNCDSAGNASVGTSTWISPNEAVNEAVNYAVDGAALQ